MADAGEVEEEESISKCESIRLKSLAEQSYATTDLTSALKYTKRAHRLCPTLPGLSDMLTTFKILTAAAAADGGSTHWYKILELEPFCNIKLIKKQYKKLALVLHPDKNKSVGSEEAFKLVNEAFRVLNDKVLREEYDAKLRVEMHKEVDGLGEVVALETFWTACVACKLLHQFERRYLGQNLTCPNCKKSFKAVEVVDDGKEVERNAVNGDDEDWILSRRNSKRKMSSVGDVMKSFEKAKKDDKEGPRMADDDNFIEDTGVDLAGRYGSDHGGYSPSRASQAEEGEDDEVNDLFKRLQKLKASKKKMSSVGDVMKRSEKAKMVEGSGNEGLSKRSRVMSSRVRRSVRLKAKRMVMDDDEEEEEEMTLAEMKKLKNDVDNDEEEGDMMTLAEMKKFGKNDVDNDKEGGDMMTLAEMKKLSKMNVSNDDDDDDEVMTLAEMQKVLKKNVNDVNLKVRFKVNKKDKVPKSASRSTKTKNKTSEKTEIQDVDKVPRSGLRSRKSKNKTSEETENQDVDIMPVEDSDFYDFDKRRAEQSFKKGQTWALYDDDDGMPRHYGLINEVVSRYPFKVEMSWLDPQINTDEELLNLERTGFHISCGRFKVASTTLVESLNVFSHNVDCERAAKEVYRIYPKKGSVWALYSENRERENELVGDRRRYDIVVFLTSYSEVHGLSMAYLEKISGFKTIFRRREIGCHAIKWLEKHEVRLFSHQIPARKLSREEVPDISGDCWELDPASLPTQVATL